MATARGDSLARVSPRHIWHTHSPFLLAAAVLSALRASALLSQRLWQLPVLTLMHIHASRSPAYLEARRSQWGKGNPQRTWATSSASSPPGIVILLASGGDVCKRYVQLTQALSNAQPLPDDVRALASKLLLRRLDNNCF